MTDNRFALTTTLSTFPTFVHLLAGDVERIRSRTDRSLPFDVSSPAEAHRRCHEDETGAGEHFGFMQWAETTDNLISNLFGDDSSLVITSQFWREHMTLDERRHVFQAELPKTALEQILVDTVEHLA